MSKYALSSNPWNEAWDAGGSNSGLALANDIHDTLTRAEVNAYITWFGASLGTSLRSPAPRPPSTSPRGR